MSVQFLLMLANFTSLTFKSREDQEIVQSDLFELGDWSKDWLLAYVKLQSSYTRVVPVNRGLLL